MANIDLTKAKQVIVAQDVQSANELIKKGWALIDTASGKDESGYPVTKLTLAWFGEGEPQH